MITTLFKNCPEGSNLTILNTIYHSPRKLDNGKWTDGAITLIAKDLDTGKKKISTLENPLIEYYMTTDPEEDMGGYYHSVYPKEKLTLHVTPYRNLVRDIAKNLGRESEYFNNLQSGNRDENRLFHIDHHVFRSAMNISDFYRYKFGQLYKNDVFPLRRGSFDIETDNANALNGFPDLGECPINAITFLDEVNSQVYTFCMKTRNNDSYDKFKNRVLCHRELVDEHIKECILKVVGGDESKIERYGLNKLNVKFVFYNEDEELQLIKDCFTVINNSGIDILMAWNMAFDIPYVIERLNTLGVDPRDYICHPAFKYKECSYYIDLKNKNDFGLRSDKATISAPFVYIDQMLPFAGKRKSAVASFPNFKLDTIGEIVAGTRKLSWSHIAHSFPEFIMKDFETFIIYNICDTIVQKAIENTTNDMDYILAAALETNTRYSKLFKPSICIYNETIKICENELGLICGNNDNAFKENENKSYDGAYVSEPRMLGSKPKMVLNGSTIMVCDNVADNDFTAMYPSEMRNFNMCKDTQIGLITIPNQIREGDDFLYKKVLAITTKDKNSKKKAEPTPFNRGGAYVEDLITGNWIIFGSRWLGLKDFKGLIQDIIVYYSSVGRTDATLRDIKGNIVDTLKGEDVPWRINMKARYGDRLMMNRERPPFQIRIKTPDNTLEELIKSVTERRAF